MVTLTRPEGSRPEDFAHTRRGLAGLFFAGYAAAAFSAHAETVHTDADDLAVDNVLIPVRGGNMPAYLARPAAPGRYATVLVVSEIFGVHEYIRDICRRLAKLGYVAIAPAFFFRAGDPAPLTDFSRIMPIVAKATNAQVEGDVGSTLAWLDKQPFTDRRRYAITGFCWGGAAVWMSAAAYPQFKAGVAWYGRLRASPPQPGAPPPEDRPWPLDVVGKLHAPVLGLYGGLDKGIPQTDVQAMRDALKAAGKEGELITYPAPATASTPTIATATTKRRPRTAGRGSWPGSPRTAPRQGRPDQGFPPPGGGRGRGGGGALSASLRTWLAAAAASRLSSLWKRLHPHPRPFPPPGGRELASGNWRAGVPRRLPLAFVLAGEAFDVLLEAFLVLVLDERHLVLGFRLEVGVVGEVDADVLRRSRTGLDVLALLVGLEGLGFHGLVDLGGLVGLFLEALLVGGCCDDFLFLFALVVGRAGADAAGAHRLFRIELGMALGADSRAPAQVVELGLAVRADLFLAQFGFGQGGALCKAAD